MKSNPKTIFTCSKCGAPRQSSDDSCPTCHVMDQWNLAVETSNVDSLIRNIKPQDVELVVRLIRHLREEKQTPSRSMPNKARKSPQEFDFALNELERTARGLELTSLEAIGALEMVKQSFIEEMLYEDYQEDGED